MCCLVCCAIPGMAFSLTCCTRLCAAWDDLPFLLVLGCLTFRWLLHALVCCFGVVYEGRRRLSDMECASLTFVGFVAVWWQPGNRPACPVAGRARPWRFSSVYRPSVTGTAATVCGELDSRFLTFSHFTFVPTVRRCKFHGPPFPCWYPSISELLEDSRPHMDDWMEGPDNNPFGVSA